MKIETKENFSINDVEMKGRVVVDIEDEGVTLTQGCYYNFGKCPISKVKRMVCDDNEIIRNGKVLVSCDQCDGCPMLQQVELFVYTGPSRGRREPGYYCGKNKVYSEDISKLKKSKIKSKSEIEEKKSYEQVEEKFKRRRAKYITEETIKECIKDIESCLSTEYGTYNEYGHEVLMLESMYVTKNKFGYKFVHDGRIGDDGWYNTIRLHKKCDIDALRGALARRFGKRVDIRE